MIIPNTPSAAYSAPGIINLEGRARRKYDPALVIRIVCEYFDIKEEDVRGKRKPAEVANARHVCFYLLYNYSNVTVNTIGKMFGRHHSTVLHANAHIKGLIHARHVNSLQIDIRTILIKIDKADISI